MFKKNVGLPLSLPWPPCRNDFHLGNPECHNVAAHSSNLRVSESYWNIWVCGICGFGTRHAEDTNVTCHMLHIHRLASDQGTIDQIALHMDRSTGVDKLDHTVQAPLVHNVQPDPDHIHTLSVVWGSVVGRPHQDELSSVHLSHHLSIIIIHHSDSSFDDSLTCMLHACLSCMYETFDSTRPYESEWN